MMTGVWHVFLCVVLWVSSAWGDDYVKDMGPSFPGESRFIDIEIPNKSGQNWSVQTIEKSCACTEVALLTKIVEPEASLKLLAYIEVAINDDKGRYSIVVHYSMNGIKKEHNIRLVTDIAEYILVQKRIIISGDQPEKLTLLLNKQREAEWDEVKVIKSPVWCTAHIKRNGQSAFLVVTNTQQDYGRSTGLIHLEFSQNGQALKRIQHVKVTSVKLGPLSVPPNSLMLGTIMSGDTRMETFQIESQDREITAVEVQLPNDNQVKAVLINEDEKQLLRITVTGTPDLGTKIGSLRIRDSQNGWLQVPYIMAIYKKD